MNTNENRNLTPEEWESLDWPPPPKRKPPGYKFFDWTKEHATFLDEHYWHIPKQVVADKFMVSMGALDSYIVKLQKKKGLLKTPKVNEGNFRQGVLPENSLPVGSTVLVKIRNTHKIKVAEGKWEYYARYLWKKHFGKIPDGHVVGFKDGNSQNYTPSNLECVDRATNAQKALLSDGMISVWLSKKGRGGNDKELQKALLHTEEGKGLIRMKRNSHLLKKALEEANG